ncbi:ABC transporter [Anoxybacter fermentans]|uniref:ABC transporter n=2 Tax=Anoxybacter fermentans TaxID=1323375 RepID=A0A3S9T2M2_9FIRM|nr:ABC transporter [Anoxybacter fermentans]
MNVIFRQFKFLWQQMPKGYKQYYTIYMLISVVHVFIFLLLPLIYRDIIDALTKEHYSPEKIFLYIILTLAGYASIRIWSLINIYFKEKMKKIIMDKLFHSVLEMDSAHFKSREPGYWASIFSKDIDMTSNMYLDFVYTLPAEGIALVAILVIIAINCMPITFVILSGLAIAGFINYWRDKYVVPYYDKAQEDFRNTIDIVNAYLKGVGDLLHNQAENVFIQKLKERFVIYSNHLEKYFKKDSISEYFISVTNEVTKMASVGLSLFFFIKGNFTFGTAILLIMFSSTACEKAKYLVENFKWLMNFPPHIKKVQMAIESPQLIKSKQNISSDFIALNLNNIGVKYNDKWVIRHFSMEIKKGEKVALLGKSGIGKSTILKVISGSIRPCEGKVEFIYCCPKIGLLSQRCYLFNRTIRENMLSVKPDAKDEEIIEVLKNVGLFDWFRRLPLGLNTQIGQLGKLVSGGEKARLSLAQLILLNPDLVLIDEPFVGVDKERKDEIMQYMKKFLQDKTCIIVTHDDDIVKTLALRCVYVRGDSL